MNLQADRETLLKLHADVAWIDANITFNNPNWVLETKHALQHHPFVQLFQTAADLGPDGHTMQIHRGFGWNWAQGLDPPGSKTYPTNGYWHPGYVWYVVDQIRAYR
jgi:hypothetical protein